MVAEVTKNDAMILRAEAVERRLDTLQSLDVTFLGFEKARVYEGSALRWAAGWRECRLWRDQ